MLRSLIYIFSLYLFSLIIVSSCATTANESNHFIELHNQFNEVGELQLRGGRDAAEISAFDPSSGLLFVTNNAIGNRIDVIDINNPTSPIYRDSIEVEALPKTKLTLNSLAVKNGLLAVAVSNSVKQSNGIVYVFKTDDFSLIKSIKVGAMPDMVTFTNDGKTILTANEGEPNEAYTKDPEGTVSVISINDNYELTTISFASYNDSTEILSKKGFRVFGPNASLSMDVEPEYIAISDDNLTAFVTLQENNGIAAIDIPSRTIKEIFPLGYKNFNLEGNEIDVCDLDKSIIQSKWPIKGMYQPDAIIYYETINGKYLLTANEGDSRDYSGFSEENRIVDLHLDPTIFIDSLAFKSCDNIGRLKVTNTLGDTDNDGDFDELYTFGCRSFSIWDANTGKLIMDSGNLLESNLIENTNLYDDSRSDDKGIEPEGVTIGKVNGHIIGFIGLERGNAVISYDLTDPSAIEFLQVLKTGIGPEGMLFIDKENSPNDKSMLIVSSEIDGKIKIYQPKLQKK